MKFELHPEVQLITKYIKYTQHYIFILIFLKAFGFLLL